MFVPNHDNFVSKMPSFPPKGIQGKSEGRMGGKKLGLTRAMGFHQWRIHKIHSCNPTVLTFIIVSVVVIDLSTNFCQLPKTVQLAFHPPGKWLD